MPKPPTAASSQGRMGLPTPTLGPTRGPGTEGTLSLGSASQAGLPRLVSCAVPSHSQGHTPGRGGREESIKGKVKGSPEDPQS